MAHLPTENKKPSREQAEYILDLEAIISSMIRAHQFEYEFWKEKFKELQENNGTPERK